MKKLKQEKSRSRSSYNFDQVLKETISTDILKVQLKVFPIIFEEVTENLKFYESDKFAIVSTASEMSQ